MEKLNTLLIIFFVQILIIIALIMAPAKMKKKQFYMILCGLLFPIFILMSKKPSSKPNAEVSDTTGDDSSTTDGKQNN